MSSTAATVLPVDESPDHETQRDAARTAMINSLLQRGFPLMVFPAELEREFQQAGLAAKRAHIPDMATYEAHYARADQDPDGYWADRARELHAAESMT